MDKATVVVWCFRAVVGWLGFGVGVKTKPLCQPFCNASGITDKVTRTTDSGFTDAVSRTRSTLAVVMVATEGYV